MYHRIMEILVLLMDEFGKVSFQSDQMDHISEDLIRRGYTEQEINTAFFWLYQRFWGESESAYPRRLEVQEPSESSHRVLNAVEQRYITPEAFGYLLQLRALQLITPREMEKIIDRALMLDTVPAEADAIKLLTQSVLFDEAVQWSGTRPSEPSSHIEMFH